jgi:ribosome-binding protein aMBF1 (putative translation factor)
MSKRLLAIFACAAVIPLCASCAHSGSPSPTPTPTSSAAVVKEIQAKAKTLKSQGDDKLEVIADLVEEWPEWYETIELTVEQYFSNE